MKNGIKIAIVFVVYMIFGVFLIMLLYPQPKVISNNVCADHEGNAYLLEEGLANIWIVKTDSFGEVREMYLCRKIRPEVRVSCYSADETLYLKQNWYEDGNQYVAVYKRGENDSHFRKVWEKNLREDISLSDFAVEDGYIRLLGINRQMQKVVVYSYKAGEAEDFYTVTLRDEIPVSANWGNGHVFILTEDNELYWSEAGSTPELFAEGEVTFLSTTKKGVCYQMLGQDDLVYRTYLDRVSYIYKNMDGIWDIQCGEDDAKAVALMNGTDGKDLVFFSDYGKERSFQNTNHPSVFLVISNLSSYLMIYTAAYALICLSVFLAMKKLATKRKLLYQIILTLILVSGTGILLMFGGYIANERNQLNAEKQFLAKTCVSIQKSSLLAALETNNINRNNYKNSREHDIVKEILTDITLKTTWQNLETRTELLYAAEDIRIIFSEEAAFGRQADTVYSDEIVEQIRQLDAADRETAYLNVIEGVQYAFAIVPLDTENPTILLLTRMPISNVWEEIGADIFKMAVGFFFGWVLFVVVLTVFLLNKWKAVDMVVAQMDKVSGGDYRLPARRVPKNEIGLLWTSLGLMCQKLQAQHYDKQEALHYVAQFAPSGFEKLFGRETIEKVRIGETAVLSATVGMISVMDQEIFRQGEAQKKYMQYINDLLRILLQQKQSEKGTLLQNGGNLASVRIVFQGGTEDAQTAAEYGVDCIEALDSKLGEAFGQRAFILLHTSKYLCGLAGGMGHAYPFVTSTEIEILSAYIHEFKQCGIRMAVTGQTKERLNDRIETRYIGYLAPKEEKRQFHMHEILDTCPSAQKDAKIRTRKKFEKALELFYQNEFYPARSLFSEVLKSCSADGAARWYLFACGKMAGEGKREYVHSLFGVSVRESRE